MIPAVMGGTKLVMQRRWNADQALELIERERITQAGGVPTIAWQIIEHPRFHEFDLSSLETISYGGAPSAPELVRRMKERFPNLKPGQGWGMTETSATATSNLAVTWYFLGMIRISAIATRTGIANASAILNASLNSRATISRDHKTISFSPSRQGNPCTNL
jgi:acyl-CoA synthetase (AMP-forming)/AMP-acid ligase II